MNLQKATQIQAVARNEGHSAFVVMTYADSSGKTEYGIRFEDGRWNPIFTSDEERHVLDYITRQSSQMH